jgi:hypothetical protein
LIKHFHQFRYRVTVILQISKRWLVVKQIKIGSSSILTMISLQVA